MDTTHLKLQLPGVCATAASTRCAEAAAAARTAAERDGEDGDRAAFRVTHRYGTSMHNLAILFRDFLRENADAAGAAEWTVLASAVRGSVGWCVMWDFINKLMEQGFTLDVTLAAHAIPDTALDRVPTERVTVTVGVPRPEFEGVRPVGGARRGGAPAVKATMTARTEAAKAAAKAAKAAAQEAAQEAAASMFSFERKKPDADAGAAK